MRNNILYLHAGAELYGADKVLLTLLKDLDKKLYYPIVLLPNNGPLKEELKKIGIETKIIKYPILRRKYFNLIGILKFPFQYLYYSIKISKFVKEKKIDLVHVNTTAVLEGIYLKKFNKIPLVWHIHEILLNPKIVLKTTSFLLKTFSDKIIVVSNAVKNHLSLEGKIDSKLITTIYNGVDNKKISMSKENVLRKELNIPSESYVIGMVGRINSWKGQDDFVNAFSNLEIKNAPVYALIVGGTFEGEEWRKNDLENLIKKKNLSDRVILIDFLKDIEKVYLAIDLFVLPSINPDPLPTVVLEAMSYGLPVIGYNHGGIKEMICEPENNLVKPRDYRELGILMEKYSCSKMKSKELGILNQKRQKNFFNREKYSQKIGDIYKEVSRG